MIFKSINPTDGSLLKEAPAWSEAELERALAKAAEVAPKWAATSLMQRADLLRALATRLKDRRDELARLISTEMGKLFKEARAEIEKCAWVCEYYADHGAEFLADELIETEAHKSFVAYQPFGAVLAIMPWNFPFWQVFRFAAPALAAGNTALLKHAPNVQLCAQALEQLFREAGFPEAVFSNLMIDTEAVERVIADHRVHGVTLTGSVRAGRAVAAAAGKHLKKSVMELGGSDAFVVLEDADLDLTVEKAVISRYQNAGQSCIAAKRFIVIEAIADEFLKRFKKAVESLAPGDPLKETTKLAPLARKDLRDNLHSQVEDALSKGADAVIGCVVPEGPGVFYPASILDKVDERMRVYREEVFGPVAVMMRVKGEEEAIRLANDSPFGLGGSMWTQDTERGEKLARRLQCGAAFVNELVKSDPRLPFGGVKNSGYGRELSHHGLREFVTIKTLWINR